MRQFSTLKRSFSPKTKKLIKEIDAVAENFKDVDIKDIGGISGVIKASTTPQGNLVFAPSGNPQQPQAHHTHRTFYPTYGANNVIIPTPAPPGPSGAGTQLDLGFKEKRKRVVDTERANVFIEQLNKKIATLIRLRTQAQTLDEINALTLSIDTLEMTRELVQEVFINQPKD